MMKYLTSQLPGIGGKIKQCCEDFFVEEIPLFSPSLEGEHVLFEIEKRGISTPQAVWEISRALGLDQRCIGVAGMKDARAVSRQWMSACGVSPERLLSLNLPGTMLVLQAHAHRHKLKPGQLSGNRFRIVIRHYAVSDAVERAMEIFSVLLSRGVPNYFGEQRFGIRGNSHLVGKALSEGDAEAALRLFVWGSCPTATTTEDERLRKARWLFDVGELKKAHDAFPTAFRYEKLCIRALLAGSRPKEALLSSLPKRLLGLFVSAYHSYLFNKVVERRIESIDKLFDGDLAVFGFRGGRYFRVRAGDEGLEERLRSFEISPSGPIPGYRAELASGAPGEIEREVLSFYGFDFGQHFSSLIRMVRRSRGTRRPLRFPISGLGVKEFNNDGLEFSFTLPPGCYATAMLREVMKNDERKRSEKNLLSVEADTPTATNPASDIFCGPCASALSLD